MKGTKAEANFRVGFETASGRQEENMRGFERIFWRQENAPVINSASEIRVVSAADGEVPVIKRNKIKNERDPTSFPRYWIASLPFKHVVFQRSSVVAIRRIQRKLTNVCLNAA